MGTAKELELGSRIGREVTTVEAVARGRGKIVDGLSLVRDETWDQAETETGAQVRIEVEVLRVEQVLPYGTVAEVILTTKPDKKPGENRVFPANFPHFRGGPGDVVFEGMRRAGLEISKHQLPPKVVREERILIHQAGRTRM